jgi:O-antigen/teichoic acid export membrane protein
MSLRGEILRKIGLLSSWQIVSKFIGLFYFALVTKSLGPINYGLLVVCLSIADLASIAYIGVNNAATKYIAERSEQEVFTKGIKLTLVIGGLVASVLFLSSDTIAEFYSKPISPHIQIVALLILITSLYAFFRAVYLGTKNIGYYVLSEMILVPSRLVIVGLLLYLGYRISGVLFAMIFATLISLVLSCFWIKRINFTEGVIRYKNLIEYSVRSSGVSVVTRIYPQIFIFFLSVYAPTEMIGYYGFLMGLVTLALASIPSALSSVLFSYFSEFHAKGEMDKLERLASAGFRASFYMPLFLGILLIFLLRYILPWVFPEYLPVLKFVHYFILLGIMFSLGNVYGALFRGTNNLEIGLISHCIVSVFSIVLGYLLIPKYLIHGAVSGYIISYAIGISIGFTLLLRRLGIGIKILPTTEDREVLQIIYNVLKR